MATVLIENGREIGGSATEVAAPTIVSFTGSSITLQPNNVTAVAIPYTIPNGCTRAIAVVGFNTGNTVLGVTSVSFNYLSNNVAIGIINSYTSAATGTPSVQILFE